MVRGHFKKEPTLQPRVYTLATAMATYSRFYGHALVTHLVVSTLLSSDYQCSFNSKQVGFSCKAPSATITKKLTLYCARHAKGFVKSVHFAVAPTIIILRPPSDITIQPNQTVQLTCSATGVPTPNVTWFNSTDDQLMNDTNIRVFNKQEIINNTTIVTSVLQLRSIRIADAGVYLCETENDSTTVDVLVQGETLGTFPSTHVRFHFCSSIQCQSK